jgi:hypothetical protein
MPPAAPEFRMALLELLRQYQGDRALDVLREGVRLLAEALMELEVSEQVGAGRYERTPERKTYRNGYRERVWETRVGQIPLRIPKLRQGSYFPSLLEPRRRAERALVSVVQEASLSGGEHPEGRRPGPSPGAGGLQPERGLPDLQRWSGFGVGPWRGSIRMCGWTRRRCGCATTAGWYR